MPFNLTLEHLDGQWWRQAIAKSTASALMLKLTAMGFNLESKGIRNGPINLVSPMTQDKAEEAGDVIVSHSMAPM
jgi:hypothetical protein